MKSATRSTLFVIAWSAGMAALYTKRSDPQWATLLPVACMFLALGGALLWVIQRLSKLGKHSCGKSCLYIERLSDVDLPTLKKLVRTVVQHRTKTNARALRGHK